MYDTCIYNGKILDLDHVQHSYLSEVSILLSQGQIKKLIPKAEHPSELNVKHMIDATGMFVCPGLVDSHTHMMEFATLELHQTRNEGQKMAAVSNLLSALQAGITTVGEHHLGHPLLSMTFPDYVELASDLPMDVSMASGCCVIGTDPLTVIASTRQKIGLNREDLTLEDYRAMAERSEFPGESLFINATVANFPAAQVPRGGELIYDFNELSGIIDIFHQKGKPVGAHIEGEAAARRFIEAGGDVIHHGHGIKSLETIQLMKDNHVKVVITPHGGTAQQPTPPESIYQFYQAGIPIAIATDAWLPLHGDANWYGEALSNKLIGPEDFLTVCKPVFDYFKKEGVQEGEILKMITKNGCEIMGAENKGAVTPGFAADLIISEGVPGIDFTDPTQIKTVLKDGNTVIDRF